VNKRRRPLEFEVGDHVYLQVSLKKGVKNIWDERKVSTSLRWTFSHSKEVWTRGIQIGVIAIPGRSS
jgi:hypothetical protein